MPKPSQKRKQRQNSKTQKSKHTARRARARTKQKSQIALTAAKQTRRSGQQPRAEAAPAGAQLQQNAETLRGFLGNEAREVTERSAQNTEAMLYTSAVATKLMDGMSQVYLRFVRRQIENGVERMNKLWGCRTPQDVAAVQSDLVREAVGSVLESSRRMADMSLILADDAARQMTKNMEQVRRAA